MRVMGHVMRSQNHNSVMLRKKSYVRFPLTHISRGHCLEDKNVSNHHRRESAEQASEMSHPISPSHTGNAKARNNATTTQTSRCHHIG